MAEKNISVSRMECIHSIFGNFDENINIIQREYNVSVYSRNGEIIINGAEANVDAAAAVIDSLEKMFNKGEVINDQSVRYVITAVNDGMQQQLENLSSDSVCVTFTGKPVKPKTIGQKKYVDSIRHNTIVFGIGPAGTGKTYLAVALAVRAFKNHEIQRIILTRPAVEAGEKLGFLPGDLQNKVDPYLRPLYDALFDMMGAEAFQRNQEKGLFDFSS